MSKTRLLIVDDDPNLAQLSRAILERSGTYEVRIETNSSRALLTARQFAPQAVLMDVDMPGKDGGEVAREFAADPALLNVPILFLTGLISLSEAPRPVDRGGMQFLAKPATPEVLVESVAKLVASHAVP